MPWTDNNEGRISSHTAWRRLIVAIGLVLILVIVGVVFLFLSNRHLANSNRALAISSRELSCRIGAFFVGQPIVRQPGQAHADFIETVRKAQSFLRALKSEDCSQVKGARVTSAQIHRALHKLDQAVPNEQASTAPIGGGSSGTSPPSPTGSGSTPAPPAPTPKPNPSPEPQPNPQPPPRPPPAPSPPPSPPPKPPPSPRPICIQNPLLPVCVTGLP